MRTPIISSVGRDVAVFGAIAPFENVVVARAGGLGGRDGTVAVLTGAKAVSATVAAGPLVPAAESTHVFMSDMLIRATLSARALATAAGGFGFTIPTFAGRGGATYVVTCAGSSAGSRSAAADSAIAVVAERSLTGSLRFMISNGGIGRARLRSA